jgi:BirA family biotin operon repressor/biotin-[acetyl-CoA-carboxylase] ligase
MTPLSSVSTAASVSPAPLALDWHADALQQRLGEIAPGCRVETVAQTGSTNSDLIERARAFDAAAGAPAPVLRVAEQQTAGRGRLGRRWWSDPGQALTFSLGLALAPADWSGLSLAVGLAVAEALGEFIGEVPGQPRIGLKWPNDLWLRGEDRKLAGILIEAQALRQAAARADGHTPRWAVVGVGINLGLPQAEPGELRTASACVAELVGDPVGAPQLLHRIAPALLGELLRFEREGLAPRLAAYARRDVLAGRRVGAGELQGLCLGIAADGELRLRDDAGQEHRIGSGEVSVRPC